MSKNKNLRRLAAGASTAVMAVGFAGMFGITEASAAPVNKSTNSGDWTFNRTISNGTPAVGETITVTNAIHYNGWLAPTITALKDIHPACLTYVTNSSKVSGSGVGTTSDATSVNMTGSWIRGAGNRDIDYSVQYTVGAGCARDIALITGAGISANQGLSSETANAGPSLTVGKSATTTTVAIAPAPQAGKASTLTATVTNNAAGTVEFANNGTVLGTAAASNGTATYAWTPSAAGAYSVTAKYLGDATNAGSTSPAQTGTVTPAPTAPAAPANLTVNPASVVAGGTVTVSGTAEANSSVKVTAGDMNCTATADASGAFHCDIVTGAAGTVSITAIATNNVGASPASAPVAVTVTPAPTAPAAPANLTVNPASVVAGGTVTVSGTAEANSSVKVTAGDKNCTATADNTGAFHCDIVTGAAGTVSITAVATNAVGSSPVSAPVTVTVTPAPTAPAAPTALSVNPASVVAGGTVTVSGTAEANSSVKVTAGDKNCTATADNTGAFHCDITTGAAGTVSITAIATNNVGASPASAPVTVTVTPAPTAPAAPANLTVNPASVVAGGTVTVSGTAEANSSVKVTAGDKNCTATADASGAFHCDITTGAAGTLTVTAVATNNVGSSPASAPATVTVTPLPAGTAVITVNPAAPTAGSPATITVLGADANTPVTVKNGTATVCATTADANGKATCTWTPAAGSQTLTAEVTVNAAATTVTKTVTVETGGGNPGTGGGNGSLSALFGSS
ncbi:Ig-like domain repeat protein [Rhodococcus spelaei]|uniref:Ig-like domain repeat protein n=1 Tax=Rhodococcus spelaei TaxID=2546320 RepID=A0A541BQG7_9NOCA|nr:Ig-like domain repeat protein [Rhodococcus spelaei]TQF74550.1 Ig-like domain repeat protein [Rhodococcus spelaei]